MKLNKEFFMIWIILLFVLILLISLLISSKKGKQLISKKTVYILIGIITFITITKFAFYLMSLYFPQYINISIDCWVGFLGSCIGSIGGAAIGGFIAYKIMCNQMRMEHKLNESTRQKEIQQHLKLQIYNEYFAAVSGLYIPFGSMKIYIKNLMKYEKLLELEKYNLTYGRFYECKIAISKSNDLLVEQFQKYSYFITQYNDNIKEILNLMKKTNEILEQLDNIFYKTLQDNKEQNQKGNKDVSLPQDSKLPISLIDVKSKEFDKAWDQIRKRAEDISANLQKQIASLIGYKENNI